MSILFDSTATSPQYVTVPTPTWAVVAPPFTVNIYAKPQVVAANLTQWALLDNTRADMYWRGFNRGQDAPVNTRFAARGGAGDISVDATTAYVPNTWQMYTYVVASANSRRVYLDAGSDDVSTSNVNVTGINEFAIGERPPLTTSNPFDGYLAEAAVWTRALDPGEITSLLNQPATTVASDLYYYATYRSSFNSEIGPNLTPTGTPLPVIDPDHPPVASAGGPFLKSGLTIGGDLKPSLLK